MGLNKFRRKAHFRGPVIFGGGSGQGQDVIFWSDTALAKVMVDVSADEMYFDGMDLWLKDDDQLEFGDSSDFVIDWDATDGLLFLPAAAGNDVTLGSSTYYIDADWNMQSADIDLYGTNAEVNINRNLTSGVTNSAVVTIKQDNASDDQATLRLDQDFADGLAADINGWVDLGYTTNAGAVFSSTTVPLGAVRVFRNTTNTYLGVSTDGGGSYMYVAFDLTGGGTS